MPQTIARLAALVMLAATAGGAGAVTISDYSSLHVLGDSLSDRGNVFRTTWGAIPESPPYYEGRFSNGRIWADRVAAKFRKADLPDGNHAWGGAKARSDGDGIPDLRLQSEQYLSVAPGRRGDRPLVAMWAGGNDILDEVGERGIRKTGRRAANAVGDTAERLAKREVTDLLILNLPDLGRIPDNAEPDQSRSATRGTRAYNKQLKRRVRGLRGDGLEVATINIFRFFNELLEDPRQYGLRNVTRPCIGEDDVVCSDRASRRRAFFDSIHPNRRVHAAIADIVLEEIDGGARNAAAALARPPREVAPVPLPVPALMLVGGIAVLAGFGHGRRRWHRGSVA